MLKNTKGIWKDIEKKLHGAILNCVRNISKTLNSKQLKNEVYLKNQVNLLIVMVNYIKTNFSMLNYIN